jgi:hypothetical protein
MLRMSLPRTLRSACSTISAVAAILGTLSCIDLTSSLPQYAERMEIPPIYRTWWRQVEACSGIRGRIDDVAFYRVEYETEFVYRGAEVSGLYEVAQHRITIAGFYERDAQLVRHEMLHALSRRLHHSNRLFAQQCGTVVNCEGTCQSETSDDHEIPADAVIVPADALTLTATLPTGIVERSRTNNIITILVRVRNPYDYDVRIDTVGSHAFRAMLISGNGGWQVNRWLWTRRALHFRPHETKLAAFDLGIGIVQGPAPPPDTILHEFRVAYASHWSPTLQIRSVP